MFSQIKDIKHIEKEFTFCHLVHAPWLGLRGAGGSKIIALGLRWHPINCTFKFVVVAPIVCKGFCNGSLF